VGPQLKTKATEDEKVNCDVLLIDVACLAHRLANLVGTSIVDCTVAELAAKLDNVQRHSAAAILAPYFASLRLVKKNQHKQSDSLRINMFAVATRRHASDRRVRRRIETRK
jgi:hypothetical protein